MKYILIGDFRGECDEVQDYAYSNTNIAYIPYCGDGVLISNSKQELERIGQELWNKHISAGHEVRKIM